MLSRVDEVCPDFFLDDTATTEIYTLSLHDALPILAVTMSVSNRRFAAMEVSAYFHGGERSEEHTSELQSRLHLVCRLLLEKKKRAQINRAGYFIAEDPVLCTVHSSAVRVGGSASLQ